MAVGVLFSTVVCVLRCVVASRLAQNTMGRQPTTGILLPVQREANIRRRRSPEYFFLPFRRFRIVDLRVRTAVFAVSVKPEVVVSRPEVDLRDRSGFLQPRYSYSDDAKCEGVVSFDSVSITFVHIAGAHVYRDQVFGRPLQVTVRPTLRNGCPVCSVCNIGVLWPNVGWIKMPLGTEVGLGQAVLR